MEQLFHRNRVTFSLNAVKEGINRVILSGKEFSDALPRMQMIVSSSKRPYNLYH
jgi:hypothetical protein